MLPLASVDDTAVGPPPGAPIFESNTDYWLCSHMRDSATPFWVVRKSDGKVVRKYARIQSARRYAVKTVVRAAWRRTRAR